MSLFIHALLLLQQGGDVPSLPTTDPPTVRFQPWRDNYIQLGSWRSDLPEITPAAAGGRNKDVETEFQLSFRYLFLADWLQDVLGRETSVFAAYTTRSYWQVWNSADSRPFRTTEHAPELVFERPLPDQDFLVRVAPIIHQSNGEAGVVSRSWDRGYVELVWRSDDWLTGAHTVRPWEYTAAQSASAQIWWPWGGDEPEDNPDIYDYRGYGRIRYSTYFDTRFKPSVSITAGSNLGSGAEFRGAFEVDFSLTLTGLSRLHLQFFRGYGDSLLDYDQLVTRYGIGFELIPW